MRTRIGEVAGQVAELRAMLLAPLPPDAVEAEVGHQVNGSANGNGHNGHGLAGQPSFADLDVRALRQDEQVAAPSPVAN
jgi:hypothetical protein